MRQMRQLEELNLVDNFLVNSLTSPMIRSGWSGWSIRSGMAA